MFSISSVILVVLFVCLFAVLVGLMRNKTNGNEYDERQVAVQGKAYKLVYFTEIIGVLMLCFFEDDITRVMKLSVAIFVWIFISGLILIGYQVFHDAYFGLNFQKGQLLLCYAVLAVSQIVIGVSRASEGELYENGIITLQGAIPFITGGFFACFLVIILAKRMMERNEAEE